MLCIFYCICAAAFSSKDDDEIPEAAVNLQGPPPSSRHWMTPSAVWGIDTCWGHKNALWMPISYHFHLKLTCLRMLGSFIVKFDLTGFWLSAGELLTTVGGQAEMEEVILWMKLEPTDRKSSVLTRQGRHKNQGQIVSVSAIVLLLRFVLDMAADSPPTTGTAQFWL